LLKGLSEPEIIRIVQRSRYFDPQEKTVLRHAERGIHNLFKAYSVFTVRECAWAKGDEISRIEPEVDAQAARHCSQATLDNLTEPEDLPLAPWYWI
jgi:hypothetical protein